MPEKLMLDTNLANLHWEHNSVQSLQH